MADESVLRRACRHCGALLPGALPECWFCHRKLAYDDIVRVPVKTPMARTSEEGQDKPTLSDGAVDVLPAAVSPAARTPAAQTTGWDTGEIVAGVIVCSIFAAVLAAIVIGGAALAESLTGRPNTVWSFVVEHGYGSRVWRSTVAMPSPWPTGAFVACSTVNDPWLIGYEPESGRPIYRDQSAPLALSCLGGDTSQSAEMDVRFCGLVNLNTRSG